MPGWLAQDTSNAKSEATQPSIFLSNGTWVNNRDEVYNFYTLINASNVATMFVDELGNFKEAMWVGRWVEFFSFPRDICDDYGRCGMYGYCDSDSNTETEFECTCLPGYEPKSIDEWYLRNASRGCIKKREALSMCGNGEGFVKVANAKIPDSSKARVWMSLSMHECEKECLRNCSCLAYISEAEREGTRANCFTWHDNLMDVRKFTERFPNGGLDLYVRVDAVELAQHRESRRLNGKMVAIVVTSVVLTTSVLIITLICLLVKKKQRRGKDIPESDDENVELPIFDMLIIAGATNNFSETNKIGVGGFGTVYKGRLSSGKDIAVKRLSTDSKQGPDWGVYNAFYTLINASNVARVFVDEFGNFKDAMWVGRWVEFFSFPKDICDDYGRCGVYGYCDSDSNARTDFECTCLPGYEPRSIDEWYLRNASSGCIKKHEALSMCGNGEGFVKVATAKIPDSSKARVWMNLSMRECEEECLRNCSCLAYVNEAEGGMRAHCFTWHDNLMDVRKYIERFPNGGLDLYVRVDAVELAQHMKSRRLNGKMVAIVVTSVVLTTSVLIIALIYLLVKKNQRRAKDIPESDYENVELPIFDMLTITEATNNFSETNKIGEGGFGYVYKVILSFQ
ncbi:hypothetical protein Vadar_027102 [Vaccinium darrowii]|uniref:Uncharacterized protein n=1 Tax=Vaccinium darrowii TaxID=229202 RepID=A0ACB7YYW9_9ERIC|nr:hypothetical protein Vadar_027102 [Vaccinium darrowii]